MTARRRRWGRAAGRLAAIGAIAAALALTAAPAASAATSLFGTCKTPPTPEAPGTGVPGMITGPPAMIPPAGDPFGLGSHTTEYEQYGFAGLAWHNYDTAKNVPLAGCIPDPDAGFRNMAANGFLLAAKIVVASDIAMHSWASSTSWISVLSPMVTASTRVIHQALFTTFAGLSLALLALTLLIKAHRAEVATAITMVGWALAVLGLVAGVTAFPMWAADQVSSLMASTINSMDAGFVGQTGEAAAADGHASLLVSGVLYRQWLAGELGSSTTPVARRFGPALLQAQALTWQQAAGSPAQVAAAGAAKENAFKNTAAQVQAADPPAYPMLQGTGGSRVGIGVFTLIDAVVVCGFDAVASLMIIVAMLFTLVVIIFLPGFAVVGLHHGMRQAVTGTLSRAAGRLYKAVLYAAAAGVNVRASQFLLTKENALAPGAALSSVTFLILIIHLALGIALFLAVRKISTGRAIPRAALYGGLLAADLALRRRVAGRAAAAGAAAGAASAPLIWAWSETTVHHQPALPAGPGGGDDPNWPPPPRRPIGGGPGGSSGGGGGGSGGGGGWRPGPSSGHGPPRPSGPEPPPRSGSSGYDGQWPEGSTLAGRNADGSYRIYSGDPKLGDDAGGRS